MVENYLAFYWDAFSKSKGTWKPSKEDSPSPSFSDIAELHSHPEVFEVCYIAAHKLAGDTHFNKTKNSMFQEKSLLEHDLPPNVPIRTSYDSILTHHFQETPGYDTEYNLTTDYNQFRRRQSNVSIWEPSVKC